jgi:hypothetical protein
MTCNGIFARQVPRFFLVGTRMLLSIIKPAGGLLRTLLSAKLWEHCGHGVTAPFLLLMMVSVSVGQQDGLVVDVLGTRTSSGGEHPHGLLRACSRHLPPASQPLYQTTIYAIFPTTTEAPGCLSLSLQPIIGQEAFPIAAQRSMYPPLVAEYPLDLNPFSYSSTQVPQILDNTTPRAFQAPIRQPGTMPYLQDLQAGQAPPSCCFAYDAATRRMVSVPCMGQISPQQR